ncbi:MAG: helix-turn-helix transcriptional regulator [Clostridia bacterium]|jgi:transcriptional regulator with XRE-family HTH domain|nr:helix-turn-helix transcriptional regulator [Clostridia bacterium]
MSGCVKDIFPARLQECRLRLGISQQEAARRLGISPKTYNHYETGKTQPHLDTLARIATLFQERAEYLLGLCDE